MAKQDQTKNATPEGGGVAVIGPDQGDSMKASQPSASAAAASGAIGPGAVAAAETSIESQPEHATEAGDGEAGLELTKDEIETLRGLVHRAGSMDALIRWLQLHPHLN
jgi:hypothetical protein